MDRLRDRSLCLDSPSKNSYIGSYYAPPDRMTHQNQNKSSNTLMRTSRQTPHPAPDTGSRVIAALKSLQEKMRRLELERLQAEKNVEQFAQAARQCGSQTSQQSQSRDGESSKRKELVSKLHSAEARCSLLEKQLEYMRKLVESAQREKPAPADRDREEKTNKQPTEPQIQAQLQKLEEECIKLTNTQTEAERKIKLLERKLLEEEHERKLVQEKAEELQRELEANLLCSAAEEKPKKKKKTMIKKSVNPEVPRRATAKRMPFVAGTVSVHLPRYLHYKDRCSKFLYVSLCQSTSPSHSVNANVQTVLHLLKTRQPRLCERTQSMRGAEPKRHGGSHRASQSQSDGAAAMGSLSDLLLALQDELGHMSFEHQELVRQIDETDQRKLREDLERELDCLVRRMEEKAAQITKLRKHQQTVQKLSQCSPKLKPKPRRAVSADRVQVAPPSSSSVGKPSPSRAKRHQKSGHDRLQLLRDVQKMQSSLRQQDISWET
ncbi:centrosomal protein CEP57L1 isoform X2 [Hemibagrus wyckioides]|uniref:centrosomal protein CEP57L1 isoform X2 n=1 Tax=Hemibagrus wyckioides TaxID=337641 RepID=UPI00266D49D0|nr:centrosomal protein CEP57L1 isoform X2 [Hemibagrus wyckioides]